MEMMRSAILSNPVVSIRSLSEFIGKFGPISHYKVNQGKSVLTEFNINEAMKREIQEILNLNGRLRV